MSWHEKLDSFLATHHDRFEETLFQLLRIPSVSADSQHRPQIQAAAQWVRDRLDKLGLTTEIVSTEGHPIVLAESAPIPGKPCVLVYGHYDVQPPDPLEQWISPPFEPTVRDGNVYARGATDDKGQMLTHLLSTEAWIESMGQLPLQLKFVIEGEEEVGSRSLYRFLDEYPARLSADIAVISDTCQFGPGQPAITYGLKGIAYYELSLTGPSQDLHSGTFGGAVTNPANALTRMLAALVGDQGRVQVPHFYDAVQPLTRQERRQIAELPFDESAFMDRIGVDALGGESGYSTLERRWVRPTFDINGVTSGYQGEGAKTVLPAKAGAKFSFRLVPDQDPQEVTRYLRQMLDDLCPPGISIELTDFHGAHGLVVPQDSPYMTAAARAITCGFGTPPVHIREGGSIPIVSAFREKLGVDTLLLGWGLDSDNTHSPNEKFSLADFHRGIKASTHLWDEIAKLMLPFNE